MADNGADFSWSNKDAIALRQQDAITIYGNPDGNMVIRRERDWDEDDDVWIVIRCDQVRTVMQAMQKVLVASKPMQPNKLAVKHWHTAFRNSAMSKHG